MTGELTSQDFTMRSGDDKTLRFTATDDDGDAVNITGSTIEWWLADSVDASAAILEKAGTITSAAGGVFTITLAAADTASLAGVYYHEAEIVDSTGKKTTCAVGMAIIEKDLVT